MRRMVKSMAVGAAAAVLVLAGCGREAEKAARAPDEAAGAAIARTDAPAQTGDREYRRGEDVRSASAPASVARQWAASRRSSAGEAAERQFERNGADFGADDVGAYVSKARAFVTRPPRGVQTVTRANGDTLYYDPAANVFAVADKDGAPRTMFKPRDGMAYWTAQKQRGTDQASGRGGRSRGGQDDESAG